MKRITNPLLDKNAHHGELSSQNKERIHHLASNLAVSCIPEEIRVNPLLMPLQELERNVWKKNACSGCRACISICPADALAYNHEQNQPYQVGPCVDCMVCLDVCPRIPANNMNIISSQIVGHYIAIKNAKSTMSSSGFQKGGATTALLTAALEEELIDCALVMGIDSWSQRPYPRIVYNAKELLKCVGSKYTSNAILEPLTDIIKEAKNIALVGTPCSVQAIKLTRESCNEFAARVAKKVRFVVGLFCFEAYDESLIQEVSKRIDIPSWRFSKMNMSEGKMTLKLRDGSSRIIPLKDLAEYVKPGCKVCADLTAKLSDISVGSIGSAPGMSTVIVRTAEGMGLFNIAEELEYLKVTDGVNVEAIEKAGKLKLTKNGI